MERIQIGVIALRSPSGVVYDDVPIYVEQSEAEAIEQNVTDRAAMLFGRNIDQAAELKQRSI